MNRWDCAAPDCTRSAVGVGPALGLRAIGWYVELRAHQDKAPLILCPFHRPDGLPPGDPHRDPVATSGARKRPAETRKGNHYEDGSRLGTTSYPTVNTST